nr:hypothetical protein [Micromonospora sp. DSM 115978]
YGAVLVVAAALVESGLIATDADTDWKALRWHLYVWDPWFLVWGLLLGAATWGFARRPAISGPGPTRPGR